MISCTNRTFYDVGIILLYQDWFYVHINCCLSHQIVFYNIRNTISQLFLERDKYRNSLQVKHTNVYTLRYPLLNLKLGNIWWVCFMISLKFAHNTHVWIRPCLESVTYIYIYISNRDYWLLTTDNCWGVVNLLNRVFWTIHLEAILKPIWFESFSYTANKWLFSAFSTL